MDLTVLFVGLLIGVGIPLRNKKIKEYREKREQQISKEKKGGSKTS